MDTKTVLVTGGTRGLGRAMALALAQNGHRVAVTGRDDAKLRDTVHELPGGVAIHADVTDASHTRAVIDEVAADIGPVDVLINNAGIGGQDGPRALWETDIDDWWRVQETNLKGPMLYCHGVLPGMIERGHGMVINIGSYIAIRPMSQATAYAASKAALARFTDCLAEDLADTGVHAYCISPGLVLTDMTRDLPFIQNIPAEEFYQPEDIAERVCRLVTGKYAALAGRFLHVGDDLDRLLENADRIRDERLYSLRLDGLDGVIS